MTTVRSWVDDVGILPLVLVAIGLLAFRRTRTAGIPLVVGVIWGAYNLLYAKRQINATVTAGDATISYPSNDTPTVE